MDDLALSHHDREEFQRMLNITDDITQDITSNLAKKKTKY